MKAKISLNDAEHPYRKLAIRLIEEAIEPIFRPSKGLNGNIYYQMEDKLVEIISQELKHQ
jgi:hypothetical protein